MKTKSLLIVFFIVALISNALSNGVGIVDEVYAIYLTLTSNQIEVSVENQVAIIKTTQTFRNETGGNQFVTYAFPLPDQASAIDLQYEIENQWYQANISATPQDTTGGGEPGEEKDVDLVNYLGDTPLYFGIEQTVQRDSILVVELSYVELLPYEFGNVHFHYPNDYQLIQNDPIDIQEFNFTLTSARTIDDIDLLSHEATSISNDGQGATVQYIINESVADDNYHIQYTLSLSELGLFSFSTFLHDTLVPDAHGGGFLVFVAEPDPSEEAEVIKKVFSIIIDRSGSMRNEDRMKQARDAASFIVEHLNEGDYFNIVDFSSAVGYFRPSHVEFTPENLSAALEYISGLTAAGNTNISGAFEAAIPQFATTNDSTANIIIFFTDGNASTGIIRTDDLVDYIQTLISESETDVIIYTFGVGNAPDEQLLSLLAAQNGGLAEFLGSDELEERITDFYLRIRSPVLLETGVSFTPEIVTETYPSPLPNLFQGQQMIVSGRYQEAGSVTIILNGQGFGQRPVEYEYGVSLADTSVEDYQFLPKVWAKTKIEHLLIQYYSLDENSEEAAAIKDDIIEVSYNYRVMSPFTSFKGGSEIAVEEEPLKQVLPLTYQLLGCYPNPFNMGTTIRFKVNIYLNRIVTIKIYNSLGQLVRVLRVAVNGERIYEVYWDGRFDNGNVAPTGTYFYLVDFGDGILSGKMTLLK